MSKPVKANTNNLSKSNSTTFQPPRNFQVEQPAAIPKRQDIDIRKRKTFVSEQMKYAIAPKNRAPIDYYERLSSKQKSTFVSNQSKKLMQERNKKYHCVDTNAFTEVTPLSLLEPKERAAIINYENKLSAAEHDYKPNISDIDRATKNGKSIQTKTFTKTLSSVPMSSGSLGVTSQSNEAISANISNSFLPPPQIPLLNSAQSPPQLPWQMNNKIVVSEKEIKREIMDLEEGTTSGEEVPSVGIGCSSSFTTANSSMANPVGHSGPSIPANQIDGTKIDLPESEEEKQKLKLLWSLCQKEVNGQNEIESRKKIIEELQEKKNKIEDRLQTQTVRLEMLEREQSEIQDRKKRLIQSARSDAE